jgi:hypothetical protein
MAPARPVGRCGIRVTILLIAALAPCAASAQTTARPSAADDPFARRGWHLELGGQVELEAWNYNLNHEELYGVSAGFTYGLGKGVVFTVAWPFSYVSQRGVDGCVLGGTFGARGRIYKRGGLSLFWDFGVGASQADTFVPPRGTRFNYIAQGGGGATVGLGRGMHALLAVRWIHFSNNGLAGRDRNPDIEAIGAHVAVLLPF